jgi:hypothetical protein
MDARSLIAGLVIGAVASSLFHWAVDREPQSTAGTPQPSPGQADAEVPAEVDAVASRASIPEAGTVVSPGLDGERNDERTEGARTDPESFRRARPPDTQGAQRGKTAATTSTSFADTSASARSVRMKEDKDVAWSPYMEQTLRQFLASHRLIHQFDITGIDCRTTFCNIVAVGFDDSTEPVWAQVVHDTQRQSWSEFGQVGSSTTIREGRPVFETTLHRIER